MITTKIGNACELCEMGIVTYLVRVHILKCHIKVQPFKAARFSQPGREEEQFHISGFGIILGHMCIEWIIKKNLDYSDGCFYFSLVTKYKQVDSCQLSV